MIDQYVYVQGCLRLREAGAPTTSNGVRWVDLVNPTLQEIGQIEAAYGIEIPSADDMKEIEVSSRLYQEGAAHVMTVSIVYRIESQVPLKSEVTFILSGDVLITVRFATPRAFTLFAGQARSGDIACETPGAIAVGLIEAIIEREADLIERLQGRLEEISDSVFEPEHRKYTRAQTHEDAIRLIGQTSVIASQTRDSLVSLGRWLTYFTDVVHQRDQESALRQRIRSALLDVQSLSAQVDHLSARLTFLLDATIGLVGIEQNQIIKLFSVVAVMLMPPTLIASVYGMNFKHMPELDFPWAYPLVLATMVVSSVVPFLYFKWKRWL